MGSEVAPGCCAVCSANRGNDYVQDCATAAGVPFGLVTLHVQDDEVTRTFHDPHLHDPHLHDKGYTT